LNARIAEARRNCYPTIWSLTTFGPRQKAARQLTPIFVRRAENVTRSKEFKPKLLILSPGKLFHFFTHGHKRGAIILSFPRMTLLLWGKPQSITPQSRLYNLTEIERFCYGTSGLKPVGIRHELEFAFNFYRTPTYS